MLNRYTQLCLLSGMVFLMGACQEEDIIQKPVVNRIIPGNEIIFGASVDADERTRTVYGDISGNWIEVNWESGDRIQIASEQTAGTKNAEYKITDIVENPSGSFSESHSASTLERLGEVGLQWGAAEIEDYTFYAMYPSFNQLAETGDVATVSLSEQGVMTGYLPMNQSPTAIVPRASITDDSETQTGYTFAPNMDYAYMVTKEEYCTVKRKTDADGNYITNEDGSYLYELDDAGQKIPNDARIELNFKSLVTALEFEITANTIAKQASAPTGMANAVKLRQITLYSESGKQICGNFSYDYNTDACTADGTAGFDRVTMTMPSDETAPTDIAKNVILTEGKFCDVTFFLLPTASFLANSKDLKLSIMYEVNGATQSKVATVGVEIKPRTKHFFNNVMMPAIAESVSGSNWFSQLNPATYLSQLSIPGAGHVFSSYYEGDNKQYFKEQTLGYEALWNKGVRAFEFRTSHGNGGNLADAPFVCNATPLTGASKFGEAFMTLAEKLSEEGNEKECLIIIATYQSYTGGGDYDPQKYITDLEAFLDTETYKTLITDKLVKVTPTSHVGDLQGRIAIFVRPGDNEYITLVGKSTSFSTTKDITIINDWGTAMDCWDRRFGDSYARQKAFEASGKSYVEEFLWGLSTKETEFTTVANTYSYTTYIPIFDITREETITGLTGVDFRTDEYPTNNVDNWDFSFNNGDIHLQEWARVICPVVANIPWYTNVNVSKYLAYDTSTNGTIYDYRYLFAKWPESYSQKTAMVDTTLARVMRTRGAENVTTLYINSLCGYYASPKLLHSVGRRTSILPYSTPYEDNNQSFTTSDAGSGGDYAGLARDLNTHFYGRIKDLDEGTSGPLGLVLMNYIGADEEAFGGADYWSASVEDAVAASADLPQLILLNNFKFPLTTDPDYGKVDGLVISDNAASAGFEIK